MYNKASTLFVFLVNFVLELQLKVYLLISIMTVLAVLEDRSLVGWAGVARLLARQYFQMEFK